MSHPILLDNESQWWCCGTDAGRVGKSLSRRHGDTATRRHGREEFPYEDDKAWCHGWVTARRPLRKCWQVVLSFGGALAKDPQAADNICVCRGLAP